MSGQPPAPWKVIDAGVDGRNMWTGMALRIHTWVCLHCWRADVTPATWSGAIMHCPVHDGPTD